MSFLSGLPLIGGLFQSGAKAVDTVAGVFTENSERGAQRGHDHRMAAQGQFAREFGGAGRFNQFMDGLNRIPRPGMFLGVFGLIGYAAVDTIHFSEIMTALSLVPEPLWGMAALIVGFYFSGRMQIKSQQFALSRERVETVVQNIKALRELRSDSPNVASDEDPGAHMAIIEDGAKNAAVAAWRAGK